MTDDLAALRDLFRDIGPVSIAVSGGVDSMTLALAADWAGATFDVCHALSPAVPVDATQRVRQFSAERNWSLHELKADEFSDPKYLKNPHNRCFYCKSNLYREIRRATDATIVSGTNLDDLNDYRPGLISAEIFGVRHPFVEAGLPKDRVRAVARLLGCDELSELPASPCLASRVETGIPIDSAVLPIVDDLERFVRAFLEPTVVRCRVRREGVNIELDETTLQRLTAQDRERIDARIYSVFPNSVHQGTVSYNGYRMGSAFVKSEPAA